MLILWIAAGLAGAAVLLLMAINAPRGGMGAVLGTGLLFTLLWAGQGWAHEAPSTWKYPWSCCSNMDCKRISSPAGKGVMETPEGYQIETTGEIIPYSDKRIKASGDKEYHWCAHQAGIDKDKTICLFVPGAGS